MISSTITKHIYNGNGVTTLFAYTFPILDDDHIDVYLTTALGVQTLLTTNYTVDTANARISYPTVGSPLPTGDTLTLVRVVPLTQEVDWKNQGSFNAQDLEEALDKQVMAQQQLDEVLDRCVKYSVDQTPTADDTEEFLSDLEAARDAGAVSAAAAAASESAAASSASASAGSVTAAAASASSASTSASTAATQASTATTQAATATTQAGIATTQASGAVTSAATATTQAATATTQAGTATTQAGIATTQATNAATSATNAATSAASAVTSAAASATSAAAALVSEGAAAAWAASVVNPLATTGGTMSGPIAMGNNKVTGLAAATANGDALRYEQALRLVGGTMSGNIAMGTSKVTGLGAATANGDALRYEQALLLVGGTMSGAIAMGAQKITGLAAATANGDALRFEQLPVATPPANILDNGGFGIWQRGTSFTAPADSTWTADRWGLTTSEATNVTVTRDSTTVDSGVYSMKVVVASAGASKYWALQHVVEDGGKLYAGKTMTLSVRVFSSVASAIKIGFYDGVTFTYSGYHTGGGGWETLSLTVTLSASATLLVLYAGMVAAGDKKNGTYYFDSAMLVIGSTATFTPTNPAVDMERCQRFFQVAGGTAAEKIAACQAFSATVIIGPYRFPVKMRAAPTATVNNATDFVMSSASATAGPAVTSMTVGQLMPDGCALLPQVASGLVAGNATLLQVSVGGGGIGSIYFSADI